MAWQSATRIVASTLATGVVDFALPPRCPACGVIVPQPHLFCLGCWTSLHFLGEPCCRCCGLPFPFDSGTDAQCGKCLADPPPFDRLRAAVAYDPIARKVALKLKYSGRPGVAETLAGFMARHLSPRQEGEEEPLLVPVPLHRWRLWSRGYNQSALIAASLSRRSGVPTRADLLRRTRRTPPLRGLGRSERALAVRGAFAVPEAARERVRGRPGDPGRRRFHQRRHRRGLRANAEAGRRAADRGAVLGAGAARAGIARQRRGPASTSGRGLPSGHPRTYSGGGGLDPKQT